MDAILLAVEIGVTVITIPWVIWVTNAIFDQKRAIALLEQHNSMTRDLYDLLKERLK